MVSDSAQFPGPCAGRRGFPFQVEGLVPGACRIPRERWQAGNWILQPFFGKTKTIVF